MNTTAGNTKCQVCNRTARAKVHTTGHVFLAPGATLHGWTLAQLVEQHAHLTKAELRTRITRSLKEYRTGMHSTATRGTYIAIAQKAAAVLAAR